MDPQNKNASSSSPAAPTAFKDPGMPTSNEENISLPSAQTRNNTNVVENIVKKMKANMEHDLEILKKKLEQQINTQISNTRNLFLGQIEKLKGKIYEELENGNQHENVTKDTDQHESASDSDDQVAELSTPPKWVAKMSSRFRGSNGNQRSKSVIIRPSNSYSNIRKCFKSPDSNSNSNSSSKSGRKLSPPTKNSRSSSSTTTTSSSSSSSTTTTTTTTATTTITTTNTTTTTTTVLPPGVPTIKGRGRTASLPLNFTVPNPELKRKRQVKRKKVTEEILSTEKKYVQKLENLNTYFHEPLKKLATDNDHMIFTKAELMTVFSNINMIYTINTQFLEKLEKCVNEWTNESRMGDLFIFLAPYLKMYQQYIKNHDVARKKLQEKQKDEEHRKKWNKFLKKNNKNGQSFASYLITPIQRIPQYMLLIKELIKYTEVDHQDYIVLQSALGMVKKVARNINDEITRQEQRDIVEEIEKMFSDDVSFKAPNRRFIRHGPLQRKTRRGLVTNEFFLFNDMMFYADKPGGGKKYRVRRKFHFNSAFSVTDASNEEKKPSFKLLSSEKSFMVHFSDQSSCTSWFKDITRSLEEQRSSVSVLSTFETTAQPKPIFDYDGASCSLCNKNFSQFRRRNNCTRCGSAVCGKCSSMVHANEQTGKDGKDGKERVCQDCIASTSQKKPQNTKVEREKAKQLALQQMRARELKALSGPTQNRTRRNSLPVSPSPGVRRMRGDPETPSNCFMAKFDLDQKNDDLLSFKKGDLILMIEEGHDERANQMRGYVWRSGRKAGKIGWFPSSAVAKNNRKSCSSSGDLTSPRSSSLDDSFIFPTEPRSSNCVPAYFQVTHNYNKKHEKQITIKKNDILLIEDQGKSNKNWMYGKQFNNPKIVGWVPSEYLVPTKEPTRIRQVTPRNDLNRVEARVLYDWEAKQNDQLKLIKDKIMVVTATTEGWLKGYSVTNESVVGWFPASYVLCT